MDLKNKFQVENTRAKLRMLEGRYEAVRGEPAGDSRTRELTMRSLKKLINQMKEEIVRFQAHASTPSS